MKKRIITDAIFTALIALVATVAITVTAITARQEPQEATSATTTAEPTETVLAVTEPETTQTEPPVRLYDVPLVDELQLHIIETAEAHGIDPSIVFAMAFHESTYRTDAVNGSGCYGLLQIKKSCHRSRMKRLGCTDLLDPYQNVTVAVDYLAEQLERYGTIEKAVTAYNKGHYAGKITYYAKAVLEKAEELEEAIIWS